jgi:hypothetical protein
VEEEYGLGAETGADGGAGRPSGLPAARQLAGGPSDLDNFSFGARDPLPGGQGATLQKLRP